MQTFSAAAGRNNLGHRRSSQLGCIHGCTTRKLAQITLAVYLSLCANVAFASTNEPNRFAIYSIVDTGQCICWPVRLASFGWLVAVNLYLLIAISVLQSIDLQSQLLIYILAYEVPIMASWLIWHHKSHPDRAKDKAYSELVRELSQVANKSEIVINAIADGVVAVDSQGTIR